MQHEPSKSSLAANRQQSAPKFKFKASSILFTTCFVIFVVKFVAYSTLLFHSVIFATIIRRSLSFMDSKRYLAWPSLSENCCLLLFRTFLFHFCVSKNYPRNGL